MIILFAFLIFKNIIKILHFNNIKNNIFYILNLIKNNYNIHIIKIYY